MNETPTQSDGTPVHQPHYFAWDTLPEQPAEYSVDVCVYGGTAAGVIAARTLAEAGRTVALVHPGDRLGGMTTNGLGFTDLGNTAVIGGMARRFYQAMGPRYGRDIAWRFEPHVAQQEIDRLCAHPRILVLRFGYLDGCRLAPARSGEAAVEEIILLGGIRVRASWFLDTSYEGDLMAAAGVPFRVGREGAGRFGEEYNGFQMHHGHQFDSVVSPWRDPRDQRSGLLPGIESTFVSGEEAGRRRGTGDGLVQAYNFRLCMTDRDENRIPFRRPQNYNPERYELAARWLTGTNDNVFHKFDRITADKTDTNNHGAVSSDFIGGSRLWPTADYQAREEIFQHHVNYHQGLLYFMSTDERVPHHVRSEFSRWGLAADEFPQTGGWPTQLYIREARRMATDYLITESHCLGRYRCDDPIAMGAYQMDSHHCRRMVVDGAVRNEGDVQVALPSPYGISLRSILPPRGSVGNLAVPIALGASHIAFGSIRMEPVFMMLAESAAVVALFALETAEPSWAVPYEPLAEELARRGQILSTTVRNTRFQNGEQEGQ